MSRAQRLHTSSSDHAIEVAAMMGGSVMSVAYLTSPPSKVAKRSTTILFAAGAALLVMAALAFGAGVRSAAADQASRQAWLRDGKAAHEWRPQRLHPAHDWMALGGAAAGLVFLAVGLARARAQRRPSMFRIGSDRAVEFATAEAPAPAFPLVSPRGSGFVVHFTAGMEGELRVAGHSMPLAELRARGTARLSACVAGAFELELPDQARVLVRTGKSAFAISRVARPRLQAAARLGSTLESRALAFVAASALLHLSVLALLRVLPPEPHALVLGPGSEVRLARAQFRAHETPHRPEDTPEPGGADSEERVPGGSSEPSEPSSEPSSARPSAPERSARPPQSREEARSTARGHAMLAAIDTPDGAFSTLTALAGLPGGADGGGIYDGFTGTPGEWPGGGFATRPSRFGPPGGGGILAAGNYNTMGGPGGPGHDVSGAGCCGRLKSRPGTVIPEVRIGPPKTDGDLDRDIIRRHVRQHLARIRHCYEKQLLVSPDLAGTVLAQFQISPQGVVLSSTARGVHEEVDGCVAEVVKGIKFPGTGQGSLVQVQYPFTFRPAGG